MSDKKIQILRIRMNPERNIWDRQILEWLETLPLGYRTKSIKEVLVKYISRKRIGAESATVSHKEPPYIQERLDSLFNQPEEEHFK